MSRPCAAIRLLPVVAALATPWVTHAANPVDALAKLTSTELQSHDTRRAALQADLEALPAAPEDQSSARIGWHSNFKTGPRYADAAQSVVLDFDASVTFDSIVLVPVNVAYGGHPGPGYGFPVRFRVEVADDPDFASPLLLADHSATDFPNPGNLPVHLDTPGASGRCLRITATRLFSRGNDGLFALGEIMVWHGTQNIALHAKCRAGSNYENAPTWQPSNLTDGQTVLGPPQVITQTPGNGYHSLEHQPEFAEKWVQLDLGKPLPLDEIRLYAARPRDFPVRSGFGFPQRFRVETSAVPDFADPTALVEFRDLDCVSPGDNPFVIPITGVTAQFVRVTATKLWARNNDYVFALSEMEVLSRGENVSSNATPSASEAIKTPNWRLSYLNDGYTSQGQLVEWRDWLMGLSKRRELMLAIHQLDMQRESLVEAALWKLARWGMVAVGLIAILIAWLTVRQRRARHRELARLRLRIASDLHDEIGSNLGSISMLARLAGEHAHGEAGTDIAEIQRIASETTDSMRDIVWLIHPERRGAKDLLLRMREMAMNHLAGAECLFEAEGVSGPFPLEFERQVLMLFKEALNNIRKHALATRIGIRMTQTGRDFSLIIVDDGIGFDASTTTSGIGLVSMQHRAGLISGSLQIQSHPNQGTKLELRARLP